MHSISYRASCGPMQTPIIKVHLITFGRAPFPGKQISNAMKIVLRFSLHPSTGEQSMRAYEAEPRVYHSVTETQASEGQRCRSGRQTNVQRRRRPASARVANITANVTCSRERPVGATGDLPGYTANTFRSAPHCPAVP